VLLPGHAKLETLHIPVESSFGTQFHFNFEMEHHFEPNNLDEDYCFYFPRIIDEEQSLNPRQYSYEGSKKLYPAPRTKNTRTSASVKKFRSWVKKLISPKFGVYPLLG